MNKVHCDRCDKVVEQDDDFFWIQTGTIDIDKEDSPTHVKLNCDAEFELCGDCKEEHDDWMKPSS